MLETQINLTLNNWMIWKALLYTDAQSIKVSESLANHRLHLSEIYSDVLAEKNKIESWIQQMWGFKLTDPFSSNADAFWSTSEFRSNHLNSSLPCPSWNEGKQVFHKTLRGLLLSVQCCYSLKSMQTVFKSRLPLGAVQQGIMTLWDQCFRICACKDGLKNGRL